MRPAGQWLRQTFCGEGVCGAGKEKDGADGSRGVSVVAMAAWRWRRGVNEATQGVVTMATWGRGEGGTERRQTQQQAQRQAQRLRG